MAGPRQEFQYQNLVHEDEIRLLHLSAGTGRDIQCSLHHYRLSLERPPYRALSYTWDQNHASYKLSMPGDSILKVRKNLWNALLSLREPHSDCWVWCDAICINQSSNTERNHQVRLMAEIYQNANIVVAWLESAGERSNVRDALDSFRRGPSQDFAQHREAVFRFCSLRYWTRKWIIQELLHARTVVLKTADGQCFMHDMETFFNQLQRQASSGTDLLGTAAARIALQGHGSRNAAQNGRLFELVERYADNECQEPSDHVYALYSLVGDHRRHLQIDYGSSTAARYSAVMTFVYQQERIPPQKLPQFAVLLKGLLQLRSSEAATLTALMLGISVTAQAIQILPECSQSQELRSTVQPLEPMQTYPLQRSRNGDWTLRGHQVAIPYMVGRADMVYFQVRETGLVGLAGCRLEMDDQIWNLPGTTLGFIVRTGADGNGARLIGRAYVFFPAAGDLAPATVQDWSNIARAQQSVSLNCADLLSLMKLATIRTIRRPERALLRRRVGAAATTIFQSRAQNRSAADQTNPADGIHCAKAIPLTAKGIFGVVGFVGLGMVAVIIPPLYCCG